MSSFLFKRGFSSFFSERFRLSPVQENLNVIREELRQIGRGSVEFNSSFLRGIGLITLHNPERHNALSGKMMAELADIVDKLENITKDKSNSKEENDLVALILSGDGNTFCSGLDLSVAKSHIMTPENGKKMSALMQDALLRFSRLPLISIAAIEGYALGGGAELTTACDHRCISATAKIRFVHVKMATTPGWGGGGRLINIIGKTKALRVLGASELLTGQQAYDIGYADIIAKNGETINKSKEFLDPYVYFSPKEGELNAERKMNSVKAVRGMKAIIAKANDSGAQRNYVRFEHALFCSLWGQGENLTELKKK
ncbi:ClpP/crotonase-like domain-containing protein [Rhizophagus diaphanus]|nr:ClpP/crotonase-like domain-containing protein [Rhizophagus diaphanus] [Rhizophagus sp. MUCL 43196]